MKRKIYALIVTATLFLTVNGLVVAEGKDLRVGTIQFSHLNQLPEDFLLEKLPVKTGEVYSNKSLSDIYLALKRLSYISNVNVYPKVEGDTVNLVIEVDEAGNALQLAQKEESAEDLNKKTEFKVSSERCACESRRIFPSAGSDKRSGKNFPDRSVLNC